MPEDSIKKLSETFEEELRDRMLEADEAFERGEYGKASILYAYILEDYPNNMSALLRQGVCFRVQGHPREAIEYFKRILAIKEDLLDVWNNLGNCYSDLGDRAKTQKQDADAERYYKDALRCYDRALKIYPNYWRATQNKGEILSKLGKTTSGAKLRRKAMILRKKYPEE